MPSAYLMLWAVDQGSEVPVGWRFLCVCVFSLGLMVFKRTDEGRDFLPLSVLKAQISARWPSTIRMLSWARWCPFSQCMHAPPCSCSRVCVSGSGEAVSRCMMCTLPSEGVSFCFSAAAKSLLNKKADVKVSSCLPSLSRWLWSQSEFSDMHLHSLLNSQSYCQIIHYNWQPSFILCSKVIQILANICRK